MTESKTLTMSDCPDCYVTPGEYGHILDVIHPITDRSWVNGETVDEFRQRYPDAIRVKFSDWLAKKAELQHTPITWKSTTEAKYREMLEILPPALWIGGAFLVGEPMDHDASNGQPRFQAYWERGSAPYYSRYYVASRPMTCAELRVEVNRAR